MDVLDEIISEALSPARMRVIRQSVSPFRNPANWTKTRVVLMLHNETREPIGYFQEMTCRGVRRLVRIDPPPTIPYEVEIVNGELWKGGPAPRHLVDPPTEGEIAMLRAKWQGRTWRPAWKHQSAPKAPRTQSPPQRFDVARLLAELFSGPKA